MVISAAALSTLAIVLTVVGLVLLKAPNAYDNKTWVILETVIQTVSVIIAAMLLSAKGLSAHAKTVPDLLLIVAVVYVILHFLQFPPQSVAWDYLTGADFALWAVVAGLPLARLL